MNNENAKKTSRKSLQSFLVAVLLLFIHVNLFSQTHGVAINTTNAAADASAILDASSTSQGFLVPRMTTTQRTAIASPANGLLVYDTNLKQFYYYEAVSTQWVAAVGPAGATGASGTTGQNIADAYGTSSLSVSSSTTTFTVIPGLTQTITVPSTSVLDIYTDGGVQTTSNASSGVSTVDIAIFIDGVVSANGAYRRVIAANTSGSGSQLVNFSAGKSATLSAGSHTIDVRTKYFSGSTATVSGDNTTVLQGTLKISIIKK